MRDRPVAWAGWREFGGSSKKAREIPGLFSSGGRRRAVSSH
jgi:hypothetical protein